jgi:hypothetical protein
MVVARSVESWFERFGRRIPEIHATAGAIESLEDVIAMHPDLLQPVAIAWRPESGWNSAWRISGNMKISF